MSQRTESGTERSYGENASESASAGLGSAATSGSAAGTGTEDLAAQGREVAGELQDQAGRLVDRAREQISTRLVSQKEQAAGGADTLALVLQQVAQQFRQQDQGTVAQYVDSAASQVEQLADTLREQDVDQLMTTVGRYAQRQPAPFLAAAFALGFLGTRFFKTSTPQPERSGGSYGYPSSADWPDRYASGTYSAGAYGGGTYGTGYASAATTGDLGYGTTPLPTAGAGLTGTGVAGTELTGTDLTGSAGAGTSGSGLGGATGTDLGDDLTSLGDRDAGVEAR